MERAYHSSEYENTQKILSLLEQFVFKYFSKFALFKKLGIP